MLMLTLTSPSGQPRFLLLKKVLKVTIDGISREAPPREAINPRTATGLPLEDVSFGSRLGQTVTAWTAIRGTSAAS